MFPVVTAASPLPSTLSLSFTHTHIIIATYKHDMHTSSSRCASPSQRTHIQVQMHISSNCLRHTNAHTTLLPLGMKPEMSHGVWGHNNSRSIPLSPSQSFVSSMMHCCLVFTHALPLFLSPPTFGSLSPRDSGYLQSKQTGMSDVFILHPFFLMTALKPIIHNLVPPSISIAPHLPFLLFQLSTSLSVSSFLSLCPFFIFPIIS